MTITCNPRILLRCTHEALGKDTGMAKSLLKVDIQYIYVCVRVTARQQFEDV